MCKNHEKKLGSTSPAQGTSHKTPYPLFPGHKKGGKERMRTNGGRLIYMT